MSKHHPVLTLFVNDLTRYRRCTLRIVQGKKVGRILASYLFPSTTSPKTIRSWAGNRTVELEEDGVILPTCTHDYRVIDDLIPYDPPDKK